MINVSDFIDIDLKHPYDEEVRLKSLQAQIAKLPANQKLQLSKELLDIVLNKSETTRARVLACNTLAAYPELGFDKKQAAIGLNQIVDGEFSINRNNTTYPGTLHPAKLCFLQILLATLLRWDFETYSPLIQQMVLTMDDGKLKDSLCRLIESLNPSK
jgi:hypothetical protein